jgi:putative phosphoribosyl transferase
MYTARYRDRREAGAALGALVKAEHGADADLLVLGLPRGGVPVAFEVAHELDAGLDLLIVRKLGVPGHEELALGAIASGGVRVLNDDVVTSLGIPAHVVDEVTRREAVELVRRERAYRGERPYPALDGRRVVLVDDGLATGATMRAAVAAVRQRQAAEVIVAVPVAPADTVAVLQDEADDVLCPATPEPFYGVGQWYEDFRQTDDDEVRALLARAWSAKATRGQP